MPRRKRPSGYTNKRGYKFSQRQYNSLKNAISNYNKRLDSAIRRTPEEAEHILPGRAYLSQLREEATSANDVRAIINRLNKFRGGGFDLVPFGGYMTTKAQLDIYREDIARENRRRRRIRREIEKREESEGRFRTRGRRPLADINEEEYITERLRQQYEPEYDGRQETEDSRIATRSPWDDLNQWGQGKQIDQQTAAWQQRYLDMLDTIEAQAAMVGTGERDLDTVISMIEQIRAIVMSLTPLQYYYAQETIPVAHIGITSDAALFIRGVAEILQEWENFQARYL